MSLSVSMIIKNEEKHLPRCLSSIQGLADEIIVVDTGSTDRSPEIAASFGAKVFSFEWKDDFASARNASLAYCTKDWVLVLDADEAIDPSDHAALRTLLVSREGPQAFRFCCRNYLSSASSLVLDTPPVRNTSHYQTGRDHDYYVDYVIHARLFRRLPGIHFCGRIHEVVDPYFESRGLPVGTAPAILHHFGKLDTQREALKKDFYLALCEKEARDNPDNYLALFNLILQSRAAGKWLQCLGAVERFMRVRSHAPPLVLMAAGIAHLNLGDSPAAENCFDRVLTIEPAHAEALILKAHCLAAANHLSDACLRLEAAADSRPENVSTYINLSELRIKLGEAEEARQALLRGIRANPREEILYTRLIQFDHQQGRADRATSDAAMAISALPGGGGGIWHRMLILSLLQSGDSAAAASIAKLGCQAFPENDSLMQLRARCTAATQARASDANR
jgi:tetratricopeptide (TPR) repeat protein